jgi:hypothetical protein
MRPRVLNSAVALLLAAGVVAAADPASLDRDGIVDLVSDKTAECRKEKDQSLCVNYFGDDGALVQVMRDDGERKEGVWFVDDEDRLCILWKGKIKPLCFEVYPQPDGSHRLLKYDRHITTILGTADGNANQL